MPYKNPEDAKKYYLKNKERIVKYKKKYYRSTKKPCPKCEKLICKEAKTCISCAKKGLFREKNANWKGGRIKDSKGYIFVNCPEHPFCNRHKHVAEHRLVMEKKLGRYLTKKETVHHINQITNDNRIENLRLFKTSGEHSAYHNKLKKR